MIPAGPILSWYGDDFTGSSALMEAMSAAGLPAVLFLDPPTQDHMKQFANHRGIGIAGVARAQTPAWMKANLPRYFNAVAEIGAPISQYKICSTLDSAPDIGSIGTAIEIGMHHLGSEWVPLLTAAPPIGRFQLFGNLFAHADGVGYRLDRHPSMSRHPVTPMQEADVRLHLAGQTKISIGLVDYMALRSGRGGDVLDSELNAGRRVIALDALDEESLADAGALIWERRGEQLFAVGSQGIAYALAAYFRRTGAIGPAPERRRSLDRIDRVAVVSGSCSTVTAAQIACAERHGFLAIRVDPSTALDPSAWAAELRSVTRQALDALATGRDPIVFTARGPTDPSVRSFLLAVRTAGLEQSVVNETVGRGLGEVLETLISEAGIRRCGIAGGDTSSFAAQALGIHALTLLASLAPGAGVFTAHSVRPGLANLEIALKGGQMGPPDYFCQIRHGGTAAHVNGSQS